MLPVTHIYLFSDDNRASELISQQSKQSQGPPNIYDFQSQVRTLRPDLNTSENAQRFINQQVPAPGLGSQTNSAFKPS